MIVEGVLVVSEEFGAFTDARRRIDLLGVDRDGRLVVFELKRTADGGHLELLGGRQSGDRLVRPCR